VSSSPQTDAKNPRLPALDAIRGAAAVAIVIYHAGIVTGFNVLSPIGALTARLSVGVPVFFALSGFLLYRPFVVARRISGPRVDIRRYYRRRLVRIVPAYWLVIACVVLIPVWLS